MLRVCLLLRYIVYDADTLRFRHAILRYAPPYCLCYDPPGAIATLIFADVDGWPPCLWLHAIRHIYMLRYVAKDTYATLPILRHTPLLILRLLITADAAADYAVATILRRHMMIARGGYARVQRRQDECAC